MPNASSADDRTTLHLHIGAPKTGTSAIQAFLAKNSQAFEAATGVHYPVQRAGANAHQSVPKVGNAQSIARSLGVSGQRGFNTGLGKLEEMLSGGHREVLLSSENFSGVSNDTFQRLAETLRDRVRLKLIMYVRAQVPHVQSGYLQALGNRGYETSLSEYYRAKDAEGGFRSGAKLAFLQDLVGADNLTVRKYDRRCLLNGDVVDDFASLFGVRIEPPFERPAPANLSLDTEHYLYARLASQHRGLGRVGKLSLRALEIEPDIADLYRRAPQIGGLSIMDAATAREIAESRAEDNALLDSLAPQQAFDLDGDNRRAVEKLEAAQSEPLSGLTRLELLLLNRIVLLEAELEALRPALTEAPAATQEEDQQAQAAPADRLKWRRTFVRRRPELDGDQVRPRRNAGGDGEAA